MKEEQFLSPKQYAQIALRMTRKEMRLGSPNISPINYDLSTDSPLIVDSLLTENNSESHILINSLTEKNIKEFRTEEIKRHTKEAWDEVMKEEKFNPVEMSYVYTKHAIEAQAGDCVNMSHCALIKLIESGYAGKAEITSFKRLSHTFLVLNRPENSDPNDWTTWGKDTIILDSWLNKVFSADQFGKVWKKYIRLPGIKRNVLDTIESEIYLIESKIKGKISYSEHMAPVIKKCMRELDNESLEYLLATGVMMDDKGFRKILSESIKQNKIEVQIKENDQKEENSKAQIEPDNSKNTENEEINQVKNNGNKDFEDIIKIDNLISNSEDKIIEKSDNFEDIQKNENHEKDLKSEKISDNPFSFHSENSSSKNSNHTSVKKKESDLWIHSLYSGRR